MARCTGSLQPSLGNSRRNISGPASVGVYTATRGAAAGGATKVAERCGITAAVRRSLQATLNGRPCRRVVTRVVSTNRLTQQADHPYYNQDPATRTSVRNVVTTIPFVNSALQRRRVQGTRPDARDVFRRIQPSAATAARAGTRRALPRGAEATSTTRNNRIQQQRRDRLRLHVYQIRGGPGRTAPYDVQFARIRSARRTGLPADAACTR